MTFKEVSELLLLIPCHICQYYQVLTYSCAFLSCFLSSNPSKKHIRVIVEQPIAKRPRLGGELSSPKRAVGVALIICELMIFFNLPLQIHYLEAYWKWSSLSSKMRLPEGYQPCRQTLPNAKT